MALSDWNDVAKARNLADKASDLAANQDGRIDDRLMYQLDALRYELRAAAMMFSHAVGELLEDSRRR